MNKNLKKLDLLISIILTLALAFAFSITLVTTVFAATASWSGITTGIANVHTNPSTHADIITVDPTGTHVTVYATVSGRVVWGGISNWYRISSPRSTHRYIYAGLLAHVKSSRGEQSRSVSATGSPVSLAVVWWGIFIGIIFGSIVLWIWRERRVLTFDKLSDEEQDKYMKLINQIDSKLLEKFVKSLPKKIAIMTIFGIITGGVAVPVVSALWWLYKVAKNSEAKFYINDLRKRYICKNTDWSTFPSPHMVIGGKKLSNNNIKVVCPICQQKTVAEIFVDHNREIMSCGNCNKNVVINRSGSTGRPENIIIPGFYALAIPITGEIGDVLRNIPDTGGLLEAFGGLIDYIL